MPGKGKMSKQEYASKMQKKTMSGYNVTDMDEASKRTYAQKSNSAYNNAARDYNASTQFDGILNRDSMPVQGSGMRALGQGMLIKPKGPSYDSKGNKIKGLL